MNPFDDLARQDQLDTALKELAEIKSLLKNLPHVQDIEKPMNVEQAAEFLDINPASLYAFRKQGRVPSHKRFGRIYFLKSELLDYIKTSLT